MAAGFPRNAGKKTPGPRGEDPLDRENPGCHDGKVFETKCKIHYTILLHADNVRMNLDYNERNT
jgi:hypothetical protein